MKAYRRDVIKEVRLVDPLRRAVFNRPPMPIMYHFSLYPTAALWLALRLGLGRGDYFDLIRRFQFRHLRSIVLDQLLPRIAHYWPESTVRELMAGAGLTDVVVSAVNGMSWSAVGRKPARG